ncbi:Prophage antirepressor (plasmid) [Nostoc flagelliforme CCNUN1]|uniref:Prophage antirepressor n=1 Tax=Nostoc flagelliforme CCNUN1 TaxID=2038116 RepID=A0A2K8TA82_9NOSO|nr:hypothetical protein [Nostoc flagelliforme]AUB44493.1 Prophage antirepressor [Nostoc flagelliforme CCNUN1]
MSDLSVFVFEAQQVRFVGTVEKPEWVASDVCAILEIKNPSDALGSFDEDERGLANVYTPGDDNPQGQEMLTVSRPKTFLEALPALNLNWGMQSAEISF